MVEINNELCIGCMSCRRVCPLKVIDADRDTVTVRNPQYCISCGHCASVCPQNAIRGMAPVSQMGIPLEDGQAFPESEIERLMVTRRSIRCYQNKEVEKKKISRLIYLANQAPTAVNREKSRFVAVGRTGCAELEIMAQDYFLKKEDGKISGLITNSGYKILLGAPALIGICNRKEFGTWDSALAAQNLALAAHSMGLGTCFAGIFNRAYRDCAGIQSYFNTGKEYEMQMFMVLGYPDPGIKYRHSIERARPEITWLG